MFYSVSVSRILKTTFQRSPTVLVLHSLSNFDWSQCTILNIKVYFALTSEALNFRLVLTDFFLLTPPSGASSHSSPASSPPRPTSFLSQPSTLYAKREVDRLLIFLVQMIWTMMVTMQNLHLIIFKLPALSSRAKVLKAVGTALEHEDSGIKFFWWLSVIVLTVTIVCDFLWRTVSYPDHLLNHSPFTLAGIPGPNVVSPSNSSIPRRES